MLVVMNLAVVADNLQSSDHLSDGEKAKDLSQDDGVCGELCVACVSDGRKSFIGGSGGDRARDLARISEGVGQRLEVGLEGRDCPGKISTAERRMRIGLTEMTSSDAVP